MRRAWLVPIAVVAALLAAKPSSAQWQATMDAGLSRLSQSGIATSNALTLGADVDRVGDQSSFQTSVLASRTAAERWTVQSVAGASLLSAPSRGPRAELDGLISTYSASNDRPTLSTEVMAHVRLDGASDGGTIGLGGGTSSHSANTAPLLHVDANGWRTIDNDQFVGGLSVVATKTTPLDATPSDAIGLRSLSYADVTAGWRREYAAVSMAASGGVRDGFTGVAGADAWATATVTAWLAPRAALVASAGRTLDDPIRGAPRTRFVSLSLSIAAQPHTSLGTRRVAARGPQLIVERTDGGRQRIDVRAPSASRVEIMGDFTNWNPVALVRDGERWRVERVLSPGLHRIAIRVDGGEWTAPANLPHATDDLGGVVGLITVP